MASYRDLAERALALQNILIARATGRDDADDSEYKTIRQLLMAEPSIAHKIPNVVKSCRDLSQFWMFIQPKFPHYYQRREYILGQLTPLLDFLENPDAPSDKSVSETMKSFDPGAVYVVWQRALERKTDDPEGAITSARTLLESVCKHILDAEGVGYEAGADLPKLYKLTAKELNLAPNMHSEEIFRQILGGCTSVVEGLGALRNKLGDAHGKGKGGAKPADRHAELAVNLAGAVATFLIKTWEAKEKSSQINN